MQSSSPEDDEEGCVENMVQAMPREVARFIQSRFGELRISEARYEDLLSEADSYYPNT